MLSGFIENQLNYRNDSDDNDNNNSNSIQSDDEHVTDHINVYTINNVNNIISHSEFNILNGSAEQGMDCIVFNEIIPYLHMMCNIRITDDCIESWSDIDELKPLTSSQQSLHEQLHTLLIPVLSRAINKIYQHASNQHIVELFHNVLGLDDDNINDNNIYNHIYQLISHTTDIQSSDVNSCKKESQNNQTGSNRGKSSKKTMRRIIDISKVCITLQYMLC